MPDATRLERARARLDESIPKRRKWNAVQAMLGADSPRRALDLGGDDGTLSTLLREQGGKWTSGDLTLSAVTALKRAVGDEVVRIGAPGLPFATGSLDCVVVLDLFEHVGDDGALAHELARVVAPGGSLVSVVPRKRRYSILRAIAHALGDTDERHGHVRPGYRRDEMVELLGHAFREKATTTCLRPCTEIVDLFVRVVARSGEDAGDKGVVVTEETLGKKSTAYRIYRVILPLLRAFAGLDAILRPIPGSLLVSRWERAGAG